MDLNNGYWSEIGKLPGRMKLFKLDSNDPSMNATVLTGGEWIEIFRVMDPKQNQTKKLTTTIGITNKDGSETTHEVSASIKYIGKISAEAGVPLTAKVTTEHSLEVMGGYTGAWKSFKEAVNTKTTTVEKEF